MAGTPLQTVVRHNTPYLLGPQGRIARMSRLPYWSGRTEQVWNSYGPVFLYTAANWGLVQWFLEAYYRATSAKALCRLFDNTNQSEVANSVITVDNIPTLARYRSSTLTLTDTHEYQIQFGNQDQGAGAFIGAKLIAI